jgi:hypothetical protein
MAINKENQKTMRENTTKVILNVPNDIAEDFKELAIKRGIPRSSMIIYAMSWYLDYNKSLDLMPKMIEVLKSAEYLSKKDKE